ncbi:hypothetical protein K402DRAFT_390488 [Aulographum hederae CBS 113979]|uniref:Uncharacterized protein n=1 Tax=Aulographum hederae CBS 113979 TaxID=1176131 RepID=A0A6G1HAZ2_9PEZI|nr:hypothetical protein K402DRAFT_390488 [Aulographum hederae CBS 113979]
MVFPPFAVLLLTGCGGDLLLSFLFCLLGALPSHLHGLYISCVYFHQKNRVRRGVYPGGPKPLISSRRVLNGGASEKKLAQLWWKGRGGVR